MDPVSTIESFIEQAIMEAENFSDHESLIHIDIVKTWHLIWFLESTNGEALRMSKSNNDCPNDQTGQSSSQKTETNLLKKGFVESLSFRNLVAILRWLRWMKKFDHDRETEGILMNGRFTRTINKARLQYPEPVLMVVESSNCCKGMIHPDGLNPLNGFNIVDPEDLLEENKLLKEVFNVLRMGDLKAAFKLLEKNGQKWRSVSLRGILPNGFRDILEDILDGTVSGTVRENDNTTMMINDENRNLYLQDWTESFVFSDLVERIEKEEGNLSGKNIQDIIRMRDAKIEEDSEDNSDEDSDDDEGNSEIMSDNEDKNGNSRQYNEKKLRGNPMRPLWKSCMYEIGKRGLKKGVPPTGSIVESVVESGLNINYDLGITGYCAGIVQSLKPLCEHYHDHLWAEIHCLKEAFIEKLLEILIMEEILILEEEQMSNNRKLNNQKLNNKKLNNKKLNNKKLNLAVRRKLTGPFSDVNTFEDLDIVCYEEINAIFNRLKSDNNFFYTIQNLLVRASWDPLSLQDVMGTMCEYTRVVIEGVAESKFSADFSIFLKESLSSSPDFYPQQQANLIVKHYIDKQTQWWKSGTSISSAETKVLCEYIGTLDNNEGIIDCFALLLQRCVFHKVISSNQPVQVIEKELRRYPSTAHTALTNLIYRHPECVIPVLKKWSKNVLDDIFKNVVVNGRNVPSNKDSSRFLDDEEAKFIDGSKILDGSCRLSQVNLDRPTIQELESLWSGEPTEATQNGQLQELEYCLVSIYISYNMIFDSDLESSHDGTALEESPPRSQNQNHDSSGSGSKSKSSPKSSPKRRVDLLKKILVGGMTQGGIGGSSMGEGIEGNNIGESDISTPLNASTDNTMATVMSMNQSMKGMKNATNQSMKSNEELDKKSNEKFDLKSNAELVTMYEDSLIPITRDLMLTYGFLNPYRTSLLTNVLQKDSAFTHRTVGSGVVTDTSVTDYTENNHTTTTCESFQPILSYLKWFNQYTAMLRNFNLFGMQNMQNNMQGPEFQAVISGEKEKIIRFAEEFFNSWDNASSNQNLDRQNLKLIKRHLSVRVLAGMLLIMGNTLNIQPHGNNTQPNGSAHRETRAFLEGLVSSPSGGDSSGDPSGPSDPTNDSWVLQVLGPEHIGEFVRRLERL